MKNYARGAELPDIDLDELPPPVLRPAAMGEHVVQVAEHWDVIEADAAWYELGAPWMLTPLPLTPEQQWQETQPGGLR